MKYSIAYLAGFFDGEGCIGVYKTSQGGHLLKVQIVQSVSKNSTRLFQFLKDVFGGNFSRHKTTHQPKYQYQIDARDAERFLRTIRPRLIFKAAQADVAIKWIESRPIQKRKKNGQLGTIRRAKDAKVSMKLKQMKKRGL